MIKKWNRLLESKDLTGNVAGNGWLYVHGTYIPDTHGVCGINMLSSYPIKTRPNPQLTPTPQPSNVLYFLGVMKVKPAVVLQKFLVYGLNGCVVS